MRTYQTVVVIDSLLKSEEIEATIEKILRIINNNGGKVLNVDRWEKRRLAYEIRKRQYGYYVEIIFEAPSNLVKILERDYRLDENILRYLTVTLSKKALIYLDQIKMAKQVPEEKEIPELEELIEAEELDETEEEPVELATEPDVE